MKIETKNASIKIPLLDLTPITVNKKLGWNFL
jgi:hypothetical protein